MTKTGSVVRQSPQFLIVIILRIVLNWLSDSRLNNINGRLIDGQKWMTI